MVEDIVITDAGGLAYAKLKQMHFTLGGRKKCWDIVVMHDSVATLIYEKDTHTFILVKQFRPPVYLQNKDGFTFELCAGLVDKDKNLEEIARDEIQEETGYDVSLESIQKVTSFYTSVGKSGAKQTLFYVEVESRQKTAQGGGIDTEQIEVIKLPVSELEDFLFDETKAKPPGLMFAFLWWTRRHGNTVG